jgi:hypothetical protein
VSKPENRRIASQVGRSHRGVAWHGPSVLETLEGVDAHHAAAKPHPELHSIWELVLHVTAWQKMGLLSLEGGTYISMTGDADWPTVPAVQTVEEWEAAQQEMISVNDRFVEAIRAFPVERLEEIVPGAKFDFYFLLHGIAQHNIYHAGQISLLKRLR